MKKFLRALLVTLCWIFLLWIIISSFQVWNCQVNSLGGNVHNYPAWNFFVVVNHIFNV